MTDFKDFKDIHVLYLVDIVSSLPTQRDEEVFPLPPPGLKWLKDTHGRRQLNSAHVVTIDLPQGRMDQIAVRAVETHHRLHIHFFVARQLQGEPVDDGALLQSYLSRFPNIRLVNTSLCELVAACDM